MPVTLVSMTWRTSLEVLVEEGVAQAVAGVGEQRVDRVGRRPPSTSSSTPSSVARSACDGFDLGASPRELVCGLLRNLRLVGGDDEIEALLGAALGGSSQPMPDEAPVTTASGLLMPSCPCTSRTPRFFGVRVEQHRRRSAA